MAVELIVSGGQTGADRAALDFALQHGIPHGGWCPRGRLAEDGVIPPDYRLRETPTRRYAERTEWNVRDSDATVIFSLAGELAGGSKTTLEVARRLGKPWLHLSQSREGPSAALQLKNFVDRHQVRILNVAGPRASQEPGVGNYVTEVLSSALL